MDSEDGARERLRIMKIRSTRTEEWKWERVRGERCLTAWEREALQSRAEVG